ncbi:hypothetical protein CPU12_13540 [Malaciobacter molluscorum LMG 25693]|uniref:Uncharacterized protein n=1 Tax=Malaciobacter molluscorum LMG 25693 TaxID=870501 RepID=A0A2G1DEC0_9BACT|nr:hypothetical protein [Malaciobacter molluscorum]AXX93596.1 hypothetical protein AMOL_2657 [Malaciobacter molluscorum LMG 25693]PHO16847.1 hypothetical protein CPU12_13540 [Malaciobacter molluscorum LMG 25693]
MNKKSQKSKHPNGILNVLVLIAGTTDPVNASTEKSKYANSYTQETSQDLALQNHESYTQVPVNYWDKEFKEQIETFDEEYVNLVLFPFHGWTGDNSKENREIAGAYLVNRLCGANGEKAYYEETWQNKPIYFHLLGHSHGGNVVNEMTKQIDKLGSKWPKDWKIKSLIYLSTPFFKKLHQVKVNENFFHKDAEVLSLYNDFDLTQRMLADFSMETLSDEIEKLDTSGLSDVIDDFKTYVESFPIDNLKDYGWDKGYLTMSYQDGLEVYNYTIKQLLPSLKDILAEIVSIINQLSEQKTYEINHKDLKKKIDKKEHTIIEATEAKNLKSFIQLIDTDINEIITDLKKVVENNKSASTFSKLEYLKILFADAEIQLIPNLIEFLNINPATLQGAGNPLWNTLYKILQHNIAYYDNTYAKPDIQFENSFLKDKITNINVTNDDIYSSKKESKNYYEFIKYIEEIEERYEKNKTQFNLLDLLFTLIANDKKAKTLLNTLPSIINKIDIVEYIVTGEADRRLKLLRKLLTNIKTVFDVRSFGELEDSSQKLILEQEENNKDSNPYNDTLKRGSLMYFLIESHSTSRRRFHQKVKKFLKRLGAKR